MRAPTDRVTIVTPLVGSDGGVASHVLDSARALEHAGTAVSFVSARVEAGYAKPWALIPDLDLSDPPQDAVGAVVAAVAQTNPDVIHLHDVFAPPIVTELRAVAPVVA